MVIQKAKELGIDSKLKCCEEFVRQTIKYNANLKKVTTRKLQKTALILASDGSHEIEIATLTHFLQSAGITVTIANVDGHGPVTCSHGLIIFTNEGLKNVSSAEPYGAIVIPGRDQKSKRILNPDIGRLLKEQEQNEGIIAAIGSSVNVIKQHSIGFGRKIACDPDNSQLDSDQYVTVSNIPVVIDDKLITAQSIEHVTDLSMAIVKIIVGKKKSTEIAQRLVSKIHSIEDKNDQDE